MKRLIFSLFLFFIISACSEQEGYAWDAFYDQNGNIQWRCRDINTKRFAKSSFCKDKIKEDNTWPKK